MKTLEVGFEEDTACGEAYGLDSGNRFVHRYEVLADTVSAIGKGALNSVPLGDHHLFVIVAFASIRNKRMRQPVSRFLCICYL